MIPSEVGLFSKRFKAYAPDSIRPEAPCGVSFEDLMQSALAEARLAVEECEVPVGCVVVDRTGKIVASAHNQNQQLQDPTAHAEILALRAAGAKVGLKGLESCALVVTLEPCPMCAAAIVNAGISGVVYGCVDTVAGAIVSRWEYFDPPLVSPKPMIWHLGGVLAEPCRRILQEFFVRLRHKS